MKRPMIVSVLTTPLPQQRYDHRLRHFVQCTGDVTVTEPWSNGPVEGQVNRLKTIKRQMYGRAGVELLRARLIPLAP